MSVLAINSVNPFFLSKPQPQAPQFSLLIAIKGIIIFESEALFAERGSGLGEESFSEEQTKAIPYLGKMII